MALADTDSIWERSGWEKATAARLPVPRRSAGATLWHVLLFALVAFAGYKAWQSRDLERDPGPAIGTAGDKLVPCRAAEDEGLRQGAPADARGRC
jgi:hypothetical protein